MTYKKCSHLLPVYLESELAAPAVRDYLRGVLAWAREARHQEGDGYRKFRVVDGQLAGAMLLGQRHGTMATFQAIGQEVHPFALTSLAQISPGTI